MAGDDGIWVAAAAAATTDCTAAAIDGKPIVRPNCEGGKEAEEREKYSKILFRRADGRTIMKIGWAAPSQS